MIALPDFSPAHAPPAKLPLPGARQALHAWLTAGWQSAGFTIPLPAHGWEACPIELADLTHAGALLAAKALRQSPRQVASQWQAALAPHPFVSAIAIVGPGHLNLTLSPEGWAALLSDAGAFEPLAELPPVLLEFVSANPTGPLHLGHARQAILGDALARLLRHAGQVVGTEFYSNDDGAQIAHLVGSLALRMQQLQGCPLVFERETPEGEPLPALPPGGVYFPRDGYHGHDIVELATRALLGGVEPGDLKAFAIAAIAHQQQEDLAAMGVVFDSFASEAAMHQSGQVDRVVQALKHHAYRALCARQETESKPGAKPAWFLETTVFGDDKDRVMQKHDGLVPYFIPDVAYHVNKFQRGWTRAINIQGADHHGTLARLRAGLQFLGLPAGYPQAMFHTMVSVLRAGLPVAASKRAGTALPARQLVDELGPDAFRMSLLANHPETPLTIDLDVWTSRGMNNPVYAVQYAHARLCSMLDRGQQEAPGSVSAPDWHPAEKALAKQVLVWEDRMARAAASQDPVRATSFLRELAASVHAAYQQGPKLLSLDAPSRGNRMQLFAAAHQAVATGHAVVGVSAPLRMEPAPTNPPRPASIG